MLKTWRVASGVHQEPAVLVKVLIESKSGTDSKALHQSEAGAVGEAKLLVDKGLEDFPGRLQRLRGYTFHPQDTATPNSFTEPNGHGMAGFEPYDGIAFIQDVFAGNKVLAGLKTGITKRYGVVVVCIPAVFNGKEGRRVHKDHFLR